MPMPQRLSLRQRTTPRQQITQEEEVAVNTNRKFQLNLTKEEVIMGLHRSPHGYGDPLESPDTSSILTFDVAGSIESHAVHLSCGQCVSDHDGLLVVC